MVFSAVAPRWPVSLRSRLIVVMTLSAAVFMALFWVLQEPLLEYRLVASVEADLTQVGNAVVDELAAGDLRVVDQLAAAEGARIQVYALSGKVLHDSSRNGPGALEPAPVDLAKLRTQPIQTRLATNARGAKVLSVALQAPNDRAVLLTSRLNVVNAARKSMATLVITAGALMLLIVLVITAVLSQTFVGPVRALTEGANQLAAGDLSARLDESRRDELGALATAFNRMADRLAQELSSSQSESTRLRTVLNTMVEAVFVVDAEERVTLTNRAFDRLFGLVSRETPLGQTRLDPELVQAVRGKLDARDFSGAFDEHDFRLPTRKGPEPRYFRVHVAQLAQAQGVVVVLHDMTKVRLTDKVRRDFIANASHELRTPLTAIRGFAETLTGDAVKDATTRDRFMGLIVSNTVRLQRLVDDMLTLSKNESANEPLPLKNIDVVPLAADVLSTWESQASAKRITLALDADDGPQVAHADEQAVDQILVNLVDNAVKYSDEGSEVRIRVFRKKRFVRIAVTDNGPGIPLNHQRRIFERFYRVDAGRSRTLGGTGLGLSIVRHLAERMGGRISLKSREGEGSTFTLKLVAVQPLRNSVPPAPAVSQPPSAQPVTSQAVDTQRSDAQHRDAQHSDAQPTA